LCVSLENQYPKEIYEEKLQNLETFITFA